MKLYAGAFGTSAFPATLNGTSYTPGSSSLEAFGIYYPSGSGGTPFALFYKTGASSSSSAAAANVNTAFGLRDLDAVMADIFDRWTPESYGGYLEYDPFPPSGTLKNLNQDIPPLIFCPSAQGEEEGRSRCIN